MNRPALWPLIVAALIVPTVAAAILGGPGRGALRRFAGAFDRHDLPVDFRPDPDLAARKADSEAVNGTAEAIVGNRTLIVEPTQMANNAVISSTGTG